MPRVGGRRSNFGIAPGSSAETRPAFRTIQVRPKDPLTHRQQAPDAANRLRPAVPTCYDRRRHPGREPHVRHEAAGVRSAARRRGGGWPLAARAQQGERGGPTPSPQGAAVHFVGLNDGANLPSRVTIRFGLRDMGVAPAGLERDNSGHHHLLIDTELPPLDKPIPNDFNHLHFGAGQTEAEVTLKPGPHTLQLLFGDKDHVPHNPPVMSPRIRVVVAEPEPPKTTVPPTRKFKRIRRGRR